MSTTFLTGCTGVVGSAIGRALLEQPDMRLKVLTRGASNEEAHQRVEQLRRSWSLPEGDVMSRMEVVRGDASQPRFGLDAGQFERIAAESTRIIHCAALVHMNLPLGEARAVAVGGTENILDLARASRRAGSLEKVEFLSTVGVGGRRPGLLPERRITEPRTFHNTYEQAKAEAELLVFDAVAEGLPVTVHRPSMIVGSSQTGEIARFQIFYHLVEFLSGRRTFGISPRFGATRLDIVPVDYVTRAVVWSSGTQVTRGAVVHLCTGPEGSPRLDELQSRVRDAFGAASLAVPRRVSIPPAVLRAAVPLIRGLLPAQDRRALSTLPIFLAYLSENQGFANADAIRILGGAGIRLPPVESYLGRILAHYLSSRPRARRS